MWNSLFVIRFQKDLKNPFAWNLRVSLLSSSSCNFIFVFEYIKNDDSSQAIETKKSNKFKFDTHCQCLQKKLTLLNSCIKNAHKLSEYCSICFNWSNFSFSQAFHHNHIVNGFHPRSSLKLAGTGLNHRSSVHVLDLLSGTSNGGQLVVRETGPTSRRYFLGAEQVGPPNREICSIRSSVDKHHAAQQIWSSNLIADIA